MRLWDPENTYENKSVMNSLALEIEFGSNWKGKNVLCSVKNPVAKMILQPFQQFPWSFESLWEHKYSTINRTCNFENWNCDWSIIPDTLEDRFVTKYLRNTDQKLSGLKKKESPSESKTRLYIFTLHYILNTPISLKIYFTKINNVLEYICDLNICFTWIYTLPEHIFYLNIWTYILLLEFSYLGVNVILNWCHNKARHGICCSLGYLWKSFRFKFFQTCWKFNSWYNWNSYLFQNTYT